MKTDVVMAGVGGQGVLTMAGLLAEAGFRDGLTVVQGELHGMSQRGGAVQATLRLSTGRVAGDLVPRGSADVVLGLEPLEALRCLPYLAPGGTLLTAAETRSDVPGYPPAAEVVRRVKEIGGVLIDAKALARTAGSPRSANVVVVGAALALLPVSFETVAGCVRDLFAPRGSRVVERNLAALEAGSSAAARR